MKSAVIYYSESNLDSRIRDACYENLLHEVPGHWDIITIKQQSRIQRSIYQMYVNILCGVGQTDADYIYLAEHDVLYPKGYFEEHHELQKWHFRYTKPGYYLSANGYSERTGAPLSSFICERDALERFCRLQILFIGQHCRIKQSEPEPNTWIISRRVLPIPYIDIRHGKNHTGNRNASDYVEHIHDYWPKAKQLWNQIT